MIRSLKCFIALAFAALLSHPAPVAAGAISVYAYEIDGLNLIATETLKLEVRDSMNTVLVTKSTMSGIFPICNAKSAATLADRSLSLKIYRTVGASTFTTTVEGINGNSANAQRVNACVSKTESVPPVPTGTPAPPMASPTAATITLAGLFQRDGATAVTNATVTVLNMGTQIDSISNVNAGKVITIDTSKVDAKDRRISLQITVGGWSRTIVALNAVVEAGTAQATSFEASLLPTRDEENEKDRRKKSK